MKNCVIRLLEKVIRENELFKNIYENDNIKFLTVVDYNENNIQMEFVDWKQMEYAESLPQSYQNHLSYDDGRREINISWDDFYELLGDLHEKKGLD